MKQFVEFEFHSDKRMSACAGLALVVKRKLAELRGQFDNGSVLPLAQKKGARLRYGFLNCKKLKSMFRDTASSVYYLVQIRDTASSVYYLVQIPVSYQ